jgi:hypothetical protein
LLQAYVGRDRAAVNATDTPSSGSKSDLDQPAMPIVSS